MRPIRATSCALALLALAACTSVPVRHRGPAMASSRTSWALVLGPDAPPQAAARRDAALSLRPPADPRWQGAWPEPDRPTLDSDRRLFFSTRPENMTYFRRQSAQRWWWRGGWGGAGSAWGID